jgi:SecD/SecF fusion protein
MVRDLGIEEERQPASTGATRGRPAGGRRARANGGTGPAGRPPATPKPREDGDGEPPKPKKPRNRKHGRPR